MITISPRLHSRSATKAACGLLASLALAGSSSALADEADARAILKAMADHLSAQSSLSVRYDSDVEVVTPTLEKIQFTASGEVGLSRPDKFRASRTGGYADVEILSDGATLTVHNREGKQFAQVPAQAGFDQVVDKLRADLMIEVPGADLLLRNVYDELTAGVVEGRVVGSGVVDGVLCDHLAFRNVDTDWQIWVENGDRPLPRKYVITSKTVATAPQYTLRLHDWKTGGAVAADGFKFTAPSGSTQVEVAKLTHADEIPASTPGGKK
jgi:hypothetical protein